MKDSMTFEEALQDPSLTLIHEAIHFLEANEGKILFPVKYMGGLKHLVGQSLRRLYRQNPTMPIRAVVVESLSGLNDQLTADMVLEITAFIIKEWENLTTSPQTVGELQTV